MRTSKPKHPEATNLVYTQSGVYSIQNWTRYRTDDLLEMFNAVEIELARALKQHLGKNYKGIERTESVKTKILHIDTYTPGDKKATRSANQNRREWIKSQTYNDPELRVAEPEYLGLSPVELLSSVEAEGGTPVPREFLDHLLFQIAARYAHVNKEKAYAKAAEDIYAQDVLDSINKRKRTLRFLQKPENKKPKIEEGVGRVQRLAKEQSSKVRYSADALVRAFEYTQRYSKAWNKYAKKLGLEEFVSEDTLAEIQAQVESLKIHVRETEARLFIEAGEEAP